MLGDHLLRDYFVHPLLKFSQLGRTELPEGKILCGKFWDGMEENLFI